jgi:hypothetical protein
VRPSNVLNISSAMIGDRPSDGSSSIRSRGEEASARPMASICCCPPESVPAYPCALGEHREEFVRTLDGLPLWTLPATE